MQFDKIFKLVALAILVSATLALPFKQGKNAQTLSFNSKKISANLDIKESLKEIMTDCFKCLRDCYISYYKYQMEAGRKEDISSEFDAKYQVAYMECLQTINRFDGELHFHRKTIEDDDKKAAEDIKAMLNHLLAQLDSMLTDQKQRRGVPEETSTTLIGQLKQLWRKIASFKSRNVKDVQKLLVIRIEEVVYLLYKLQLIAVFAATFGREQISTANLHQVAVELMGFLSDLQLALEKSEVVKTNLVRVNQEIEKAVAIGKQVVKFIQSIANDPIATFLAQQTEHATHTNNKQLREWLRIVSILIQLRFLIIDFFRRYLSRTDLKKFINSFLAKIKLLVLKIEPRPRKGELRTLADKLVLLCNSFAQSIKATKEENILISKEYLQSALKEQQEFWKQMGALEKDHFAPDTLTGCAFYLATAMCKIQSSNMNLMVARFTASNDQSSISALGSTILAHLIKLQEDIPKQMQGCQSLDYSAWKPTLLSGMALRLDKQRMELGKAIIREKKKAKQMGGAKSSSNSWRTGKTNHRKIPLLAK